MGKKYSDIISHLLAVLPLSSHRKRSPGNNLIICFCKIRRPVPYQVDCEQSLIFLLNHSNFTFSLVARGPLAVNLPGAIKYIDHARKLRAQCTRQTWDHSSKAAHRRLIGRSEDRSDGQIPLEFMSPCHALRAFISSTPNNACLAS